MLRCCYAKTMHAREAAAFYKYHRAGKMRAEMPGASQAAGLDMHAATSIASRPRRSDLLHFSDNGLLENPYLVVEAHRGQEQVCEPPKHR